MNYAEIFKEKEQSSIVINIAIIRNDMCNSILYITDVFSKEEEMNSTRQLYHQRMLVVHFREAMKFFMKKNVEIKHLIESPLDAATEKHLVFFNEIRSFCEPFEDSKLSKIYIPMRNSSVHYEKNLNAILKALDKTNEDKQVVITKNGNKWFDITYDFASDIAINIAYEHLDEYGVKEIVCLMEEFNLIVMKYIKLSDYIIQKFIYNEHLKNPKGEKDGC